MSDTDEFPRQTSIPSGPDDRVTPLRRIPPGLGPAAIESRRPELRRLLASAEAVVVPGVVDSLGARLVERAQFKCCYLTGAGLANVHLGLPDVGLIDLNEMAWNLSRVVDATSLPVIVDADTGYGGPISTMRAVRILERMGATAIQLEDQETPKRCGHFEGKRIVDVSEMVAKLRGAQLAREDPETVIIARTDARAIEGFNSAVNRARRYRDAGADVLFVEAPTSLAELERLPRDVEGVPLLINVVEGGLTPLLAAFEYERLGYRLVLYANTLLRVMYKAGIDGLTHLRLHGETSGLTDAMLSWDERQELVNLDSIDSLEDELRDSSSVERLMASTHSRPSKKAGLSERLGAQLTSEGFVHDH